MQMSECGSEIGQRFLRLCTTLRMRNLAMYLGPTPPEMLPLHCMGATRRSRRLDPLPAALLFEQAMYGSGLKKPRRPGILLCVHMSSLEGSRDISRALFYLARFVEQPKQ
jgi:hypothetical protein